MQAGERKHTAQSASWAASWARRWLEGAGAAVLLTPGLLWLQLSRTHIDLYHRLLPLTTVDRALALDLVLLSLAAMMVVWALEAAEARSAARQADGSRAGRGVVLLLWALWFGLLAARAVAGLIVAQVLWWQQITTGRAFLLVAVVLGAVWLGSGRWYRGTVRVLRFGLMLLGFCLFWMVPGLVVASLAHQPHDEAEFRKPVAAIAAPHARIVWLLFDEMSYDQVFAHRWPGLELPNLDRLRVESATFSNVQPDGFFTEDVIPSLLLGKPIDDVLGTAPGWMVYRTAAKAPWQRFDGGQTLFADAQRQGWTTGALGSYNPYCRILRDQLDFCWMDLQSLPDHLSRDQSTLGNVAAPLKADWDRTFGHKPAGRPADPTSLATVGAVRAGDALIGDTAIDLCFIHLPVPHPPGNYDRRTGRIGAGGSYIDNLALSDRVLGRMLEDIAASGAADRTTVILSSDHSWRVWLWRHSFGWTDEDEMASGHGKFDPRPMLMVRFPGETGATEISRPVPLLAMHEMVEQMVAGKIESPQQLESWAGRQ